jgi:hypothetical protein
MRATISSHLSQAAELEAMASVCEMRFVEQERIAIGAMRTVFQHEKNGNSYSELVSDENTRAAASAMSKKLLSEAKTYREQASELRIHADKLCNAATTLDEVLYRASRTLDRHLERAKQIDLRYAQMLREATNRTINFTSHLRVLHDSIDDTFAFTPFRATDFFNRLGKGIGSFGVSTDLTIDYMRISLAKSLNISIQEADKIYVTELEKYTLVKGIMNKDKGTRFLTSNVKEKKFPYVTKIINSKKIQGTLKKAGGIAILAGGAVIVAEELFAENEEVAIPRRVGHAGVELWVYSATVLAGMKTGAIVGAAVGSIVPGAGTAVGVIVGAVVGIAVSVIAIYLVDNVPNWIKVNEDQTLREWTKEKAGDVTEGIADGVVQLFDDMKFRVGDAFKGISTFMGTPCVLE